MIVAVIDCAVRDQALVCFNQLALNFPSHTFTYHSPPSQGMQSLQHMPTIDALVLFGSYSNVEERLPWHREVADFAAGALEKKIPTLGICFGHQLMADHFGGIVSRVPGKALQGVRPIRCTGAKGDTFHFIVDHQYEVSTLPPSFERVGLSKDCTNDIVKHQKLPYWGVQGHPEASPRFVELTQPGTLSERQIELGMTSGRQFLEIFFQGVVERPVK